MGYSSSRPDDWAQISSEPTMELTWKKTLAIWWSIGWRGALLGVLLGALLGFVVGGVLGAQGAPPERIQNYAMLGGYLASIIASFVALKLGLQKHLPSLLAGAGLHVDEPGPDPSSER
jgi:hypothetical protein